MSLEDLLETIEVSGEEKTEEIREQAQEDADEILEAAREEAQAIEESERQKVLRAARRERAHLLHDASSRGLKIHQEGREHLIEEILGQARQRLENFRAEGEYADVLRRFVEEALEALAPSLAENDWALIEIDSRDHERIEKILSELSREIEIVENGDSWGGVTLASRDNRMRVINTLEARLERARPYLHTSLSSRFEDSNDKDS